MIPYGKQHITRADVESVAASLSSDFLTGGPSVAEFEAKLCEVTGAAHAVVCANGTAALHLAAMALGMSSGDLGITSPLTFMASSNCFEFCGASSDFVDIDPATLCISPQAVEKYCREVAVPKVVVAVDFAGVVADLPALKKLSERYGFRIIEDAAHSLGSTYRHEGREFRAAGNAHADLAILSFHPVKTITCGEGGAVTTNDAAVADKLRALRAHGIVREKERLTAYDGPWYHEMHSLGYNYRIPDVLCALGLSQIRRIAEYKERRQQIVKRYNRAFSGAAVMTAQIITPPWPSEMSLCQHLYPIQFTGGPEVRRKMYDHLRERGVLTQVHYIPVYWQPYYRSKYGYEKGKCPEAERYYGRCLSLPLFPAMSDDEVEQVVSAVLSFPWK